jgi:hypothetical protein
VSNKPQERENAQQTARGRTAFLTPADFSRTQHLPQAPSYLVPRTHRGGRGSVVRSVSVAGVQERRRQQRRPVGSSWQRREVVARQRRDHQRVGEDEANHSTDHAVRRPVLAVADAAHPCSSTDHEERKSAHGSADPVRCSGVKVFHPKLHQASSYCHRHSDMPAWQRQVDFGEPCRADDVRETTAVRGT